MRLPRFLRLSFAVGYALIIGALYTYAGAILLDAILEAYTEYAIDSLPR